MNLPRICAIVPTRERADTLAYTLQSCVRQEYPNLEILVCDNFSQDNTAEVVASIADKRVRYVNPGRRLSMADNWEYAVSRADADYVTILGDDDALLPDALHDLARLMQKHEYPIVTWSKVEYCWPNYIDPRLRGYISIPLRNKLISVESSLALKHIYRFLLGYRNGPCIYNSLVSMKCVAQVLARDGKLFQAACPDVYSSLALASVTERYLFSTRPFSVNGASAHSGGTSHARPNINSQASDLFQQESAEGTDDFLRVRGSVHAAVVDTLTKFSALARTAAPAVDYAKAFNKILNDMRAMPEVLESNRGVLERLADRHGVRNMLDKAYLRLQHQPGTAPNQPLVDTTHVLSADNLIAWGDRFDVLDVAAAALFAGKILGAYEPPAQLSRYSLAARIFTRIAQRVAGARYYFGM
jgi:hypothetical protein